MMRKMLGLVMVMTFVSACGEVTPVNDDAGGDNSVLARGAAAGGDIAQADAGAGGSAAGGAPGAGGMTGAGGAAGDPGIGGMMTGAGGAAADYTCADLKACCDSLPAGNLRTQCLTAYSGVTNGGTTSCGTLLAMIKAGGSC